MAETKPNAAVTCSNCGAEIKFVKEPNLPEGFSLACPKCKRRKIYALACEPVLVSTGGVLRLS
jgi:DNA-directed RNA polymerase subunit RPC12/RpoP